MQLTFDSVSELAQALRRAADAHGQYEEQTGHPDPDWPSWYARYLEREQAETHQAGARAGRTRPAGRGSSRTRRPDATARPSPWPSLPAAQRRN